MTPTTDMLAARPAWAQRLDVLARPSSPERPAFGLFATVSFLLAFGLIVQVGHAATVRSLADFRSEVLEQVGVRMLGIVALLVAARVGPAGVRRFIPFAAVAALILLILCYVPGVGLSINGSRRWVALGPVTFQPSELARIVVVLWVANHCVLYGERLQQLVRSVLPILGWTLVYFLLVYFERDVGGAILLLLCVLSTLWVGGARTGHVGLFLTLTAPVALVWGVLTAPHVRHRILTFLGLAENDQVSESAQAIADGGFLGVGYTHGVTRVRNVPHLESDFVLAQIGEEFGWLGMAVVVLLFASFAWFALQLVLSIRDRYAALCAFGLCISTALQALIHIEVVAGLGPPKGMPLPFVSNGGSSLLVSCLAVGLALGAARKPGASSFIENP